jgi:hypothetical protein
MKLHKGVKFDQGKPRWDLLPIREVEQVVKVLTAGAGKYADDNWQLVVADNPGRCIAAAYRHLAAWRQGEILDPETGLSHLAHAACNLFFLLWNDNEEDDIHGTTEAKTRALRQDQGARPTAQRQRRKRNPGKGRGA